MFLDANFTILTISQQIDFTFLSLLDTVFHDTALSQQIDLKCFFFLDDNHIALS